MGLRDWFRRRTPATSGPIEPLVVREASGYVGHGRRWAMFGDGYREFVGPLMSQAVADARVPARLPRGATAHRVIHGPDEVQICCLVAHGEVMSAFPYIARGASWRMVVREVHQWPDPVEGQVAGHAFGARIGVFDTHFCTSRPTYEQHRTRDFVVNAWAYRLEESDTPGSFAEDFCGYLPIPAESGGSVDEVEFSSRIESVRGATFFGRPLTVYRLTLARPEAPLTLDVFAAPEASGREFTAGDRLAGQAWLFGYPTT